ncbi:MAG TPA: APC family permease [Polyangiaceae bacterium]|nr:APC family permease [Polyangiaceae bacterium]
MRRALTTFDAVCLGVNAVVGSGIYLFPGTLASALGPASIGAWLLTGLLCLPLALTFAELGKGEERTGGPFRYAELAFGNGVAFVVGWLAWVTSLVSWAAVASALPSYLAAFVPALSTGAPALVVSASVVLGLAGLNVVGVKPGARLMDALTVLKLLPLAVFVGVGLFAARGGGFRPVAPHGFSALPGMALMTLFAYQGFEVVGVPSGEVAEPRRVVPRAVLVSLLFPALLYMLVQTVFVGAGSPAGEAPLVAAAERFLGPSGRVLLGLGGLVSMLGYSAGTALCTPRYLQALAEERLVPAWLARPHARFQTPAVAIVASSVVTLVLLFVLRFESLVDLAALAVLGQYLASSAALVRLGRGAMRALGGVSVLVSLLFGAQGELRQVALLAVLTLAGAAVALATRLSPDRPGPSAG